MRSQLKMTSLTVIPQGFSENGCCELHCEKTVRKKRHNMLTSCHQYQAIIHNQHPRSNEATARGTDLLEHESDMENLRGSIITAQLVGTREKLQVECST